MCLRSIIIFQIINILTVLADYQILYQDFSKGLGSWGGAKDSSTSAVIVTCPQNTALKCVQLTKKTWGGDLFSPNIPIDNSQNIVIEFNYLTASTTNGYYSGLIAGWTNAQLSGFCWAAVGNPNYVNQLSNSYTTNGTQVASGSFCNQQVQIQDLGQQWKTIKYTILSSDLKKNNVTTLRLVFEQFNDTSQLNPNVGAYYITQIQAYYSGLCAAGCTTCTTFFDCTKCKDGYNYLAGKCYAQQCGIALTTSIPYNKQSVVQSASVVDKVGIYKAVITIPGYDLNNCWKGQLVTIQQETAYYTQVDFFVNPVDNSQAIAIVSSQNVSSIVCANTNNQYTCQFLFRLLYNAQVLVSMPWTATIDFTNFKVNQVTNLAQLTSNLPPLQTTIDITLSYCLIYTTNCSYVTNGQLQLTLNQIFTIKLTVNENFTNWVLSKGYVKLSGNGTLCPLDIVDWKVQQNSIIYFVKLGILGYNNVGIVASVNITQPTGTRLLDSTNSTLTNQKIGFGQISQSQIVSSTFKTLLRESNPDFSTMNLILIVTILALN